jgi:conjugative relaxase-like TrwC/TraI family protein
LEGYLPNGSIIERAHKDEDTKERRPGTDLTFSAPKSVTLVGLVLGDEAVIAAHRKAVDKVLQYAQTNFACSMSKVKGISTLQQTDNLLVARFDHDTSRQVDDGPIDPQLHTHCIVVNATQRSDGKWVAAPNSLLYEHKMLLGAMYRSELGMQLKEVGYGLKITASDGRFELEGFSEEQLELFSQRRSQIEEYMKEHDLKGSAGAQIAALESRSGKKSCDRSKLHIQWKERALQAGLSLKVDDYKVKKSDGLVFAETSRIAAKRELKSVVEHLLERKSFVSKAEIMRCSVERLVGRAREEDISTAIKQALKSGELVEVRKGCFSSPKTIEAELSNKATIMRGAGAVPAVVSDKEARKYATQKGLSNGQINAVALLAETSRYVAVQGYAGTGKTTMLTAVKELAERAGYSMKGFAPSAAAAGVLEHETGIRSQTLASHLQRSSKPEKLSKTSGKEIWVVDESSMIGTSAMKDLLRAAEYQKARVWFVGDKKQLGSVEAGSPFGQLLKAGVPVAEMKEIFRQRSEALKESVKDIIAGKYESSLKRISSDIVEIPNRDKCLEAVVKEYFQQDRVGRKSSLVITSTNADRQSLNKTIRAELKKLNELQGQVVLGQVVTSKNLTESEKKRLLNYSEGTVVRFGRSYESIGAKAGEYYSVSSVDLKSSTVRLKSLSNDNAVEWKPAKLNKVEVYHPVQNQELQAGDRIRWTRNDKAVGRKNGETAKILSFSKDGRQATVEGSRGEQSVLNLDSDRHWDYAYSSTVYSAQGKTCDKVIVHLDTENKQLLGSEQAYVALSRARNEIKIFTDDATSLPKNISVSRAQKNVLDVAPDLGISL